MASGESVNTSEFYAQQAKTTDDAASIAFVVGKNKYPLDEWLKRNKPSNVRRDQGFGWIWVLRPEDDNNDNNEDFDPDEMMDEWQKVNASGSINITKEYVFELARKHKCTSGKWLVTTRPGIETDRLWAIIAKGIANGETLASHAKVSAHEGPDIRHVFCIYNDNFLDKEQVMENERTIRELGIKRALTYKPDVYTYLGIYRKNRWKIRPTIYTSNWDILKKGTIIKET